MITDFLHLPLNGIHEIGKFLDTTSVLRMREISKSVRKIVECELLSSRKTSVDNIYIDLLANNLTVSVYIRDSQDWLIWNIRFSGFVSLCNSTFSPFLHTKLVNKKKSLQVSTQNAELLILFFEQMIPLIRRANLKLLSLMYKKPDLQLAKFFLNFLKETTILEARARPVEECDDIQIWREFLQKVRPNTFVCHIKTVTEESMKCILKIAEAVEYFVIDDIEDFPNAMPVIKSILSRRCQGLVLSGNNFSPLTMTNIAHLVQFLQRSEKKIVFSAFLEEHSHDDRHESFHSQIGPFTVQAVSRNQTRNIFITHLDGAYRKVPV